MTREQYLQRAAHAYETANDIAQAIAMLREARKLLRGAGAKRAADYVARSIKSSDGARRHAEGRRFAAERNIAPRL